MTEPLLTVAQVAERLQFSQDTVREMVQKRELACVRRTPRGRIRVPESALTTWAETHQHAPRTRGQVPGPRPKPVRLASPSIGGGSANTPEAVAALVGSWKKGARIQ